MSQGNNRLPVSRDSILAMARDWAAGASPKTSCRNPALFIKIAVSRAYIDTGDYDWAIIDFNQVLRFDPNSAAVYMDRGRAHLYTGDYEAALRLNPNDTTVRNNIETARQVRRRRGTD